MTSSHGGKWVCLTHRTKPACATRRSQWHCCLEWLVGVVACAQGRYVAALAEMGLTIEECEGDGNCMFRAVSHQVYGDDSHHAQVRAAAVEYMVRGCWRASGHQGRR